MNDDKSKIAEAEIPVSIYKQFGRSPKPISRPTGDTWQDKNISSWTVKGLRFALNLLYTERTKGALLVLGSAGIGKSQVVKQFARSCALHEAPRTFIEIEDIHEEEKVDEIMKDPSAYFVFLDLRASRLNPEQASGIPDIEQGKRKGYLQFMPPDWAHLICNPNFSGFVFLDELNRGQEAVVNSLFQFVLDRVVSAGRISDNVAIAAAANFGEGFTTSTPIDSALMSRFDCGVLIADPEEWANWARANGVSNYIIDYAVSVPNENFYGDGEDVKEGNIPLNPRQLEMASIRLQQVEKAYALACDPTNPQPLPEDYSGNIYDDIGAAIKTRLPNKWVNGFLQWLDTVHSFEWAEIVQKSKEGGYNVKGGSRSGDELTRSKQWALVRYVTNEVLRRFEIARKSNDEDTKKKLLNELYNDLYYILSGAGADPVAFMVKALVNSIKHNPPPETTPLQAAENWNTLMVPIMKKANADNPEFFKKVKALMDELGKIKK